ncbi:M1 family metallopeptidase [Olleya sp. HaHaR_3_96]|uniref:M1 family metallopeptidase n=1 Tax=Olleya sp. HaHaR_3_96 TaxID=2745560 RepID=UPI001C4F88F9|nr:M1 family metallopeptidase [Olleya sp. HaHaR_3_96]QXP59436.1 M1 family metallopeptidase [Olleya sp. HaHaR_3_96]
MRYLFVLFITFLCLSAKAQQTEFIDFISIDAQIGFKTAEKMIVGGVTYKFKVLKEIDSVFINSRNNIRHFEIHDSNLKAEASLKEDMIVFKKHRGDFLKDSIYSFKLIYFLVPKKALYFTEKENSHQIWTQGQGKYTSHWLPSIDDMNDKIEFDLSITYDKDYQVIANGALVNKISNDSTTTWHYDMQKPMSSYLVALAIGKYEKQVITSKSVIPIALYYYPEDSAKVEPSYRYTKQLFDFLEDEIGVPYPWQNYKQVPVKDFLYSGMENTSCTIFSDYFMIDRTSFVDKNYVNVNAHELAHQWFGDLVTETSGTHHWLQEGFATYYALLAERDIFGEDYYYWQLYQYAQELIAQDVAGESTSLLDPKSSSTTFYKKGAWALHALREKVGDKAFKKAVKIYLKANAFKNVETNDFIKEVEKSSGQDLTGFVSQWLLASDVLEEEMAVALRKNETSSFLLTMKTDPYLSYRTDAEDNYIPSSLITELPKGFYAIQVAVLEEAVSTPEYPTSDDLIEEAFQSGQIKLRQTLALGLQKIPLKFQKHYETLLDDQSYITNEAALYNLWVNFPQKRKVYLDQTKTIYGFNDYNVRTLWLALAIATPGYEEDSKTAFYNELVGYTASEHGFQLRQNAFDVLSSLGLFNQDALSSLIAASKHHNWRFKSFAKQLLELLSENEKYKSIISNLQDNQKQ